MTPTFSETSGEAADAALRCCGCCAFALIACVLVAPSAAALDGSVYHADPPPTFGETHWTPEGLHTLDGWHTGPDPAAPPGRPPFWVYVGAYDTQVRSFVAWQVISVGLSSGSWVDAIAGGRSWPDSVRITPELMRYAPNGFLEYQRGDGQDAPVADVPSGIAPGASCPGSQP